MYIEDGAAVFEASELIADFESEYANYNDLSFEDRCYVARELVLSVSHFVADVLVAEPYDEVVVYGFSFGGSTREFTALLRSHFSMVDYMPAYSLCSNGRRVVIDLLEA